MLAPDGTGRRRLQRLAARGVVVASLVVVTGAFASLQKSVTLDVDGELYDVSAYGRTVAEVLDYQDVTVGAEDLVEPGLTDSAHDGGTIVVRTSHDVTIEIDGQVQTISTTARTVGELLTYLGPRAEGAVTEVSRTHALGRDPIRVSTLKTVHVAVDGAVMPITTAEPTVRGVLATAGIVLAEGDSTSAPLDAAAVDGMLVLVSRAAASATTVTEVLPFTTEEVEDPNLPKGHRVVVQSGRVGEATTTYAVQTLGGAEVSRTVLTRTVTTEPRNEIIKVGTMDVSVSVDPGSARAIGRSLAAQRGWGDDEFTCLDKLWTKESNWRVDADNPSSSAYGIPQALPGSKMSSAGADWRTNPATQITWGLGYIEGRYGTPCAAWSHSVAKGWY
ncbi:ubiquitin-like domain-containing protein [Cellulosimicrobium cellulans]|uniref:aggregation-promoting factor C-terminal-like domain-containing protein n=1 Tax=Cellulosimicrobium cellulans TaxID=1710 RepID=UPI002096BBB1|nr:ubiquitin-like domain-containing protein [Cellulosimicrobium cellulans]MCO7274106.1 ubiquitin-like domain-containing protein [Cellulosimicrobium cellulans]